MTWIISALATLTYLAGFVAMTRWRYAATRPFTEPLNCTTPFTCKNGDHDQSCYRRPGYDLIDTPTAALICALLCGLVWPFVLLGLSVLGAGRALVNDTSELPEERAARIERMERETGIKP